MTIQIPNPGTGNGATGDNEWVMWSKVKDNFSDATHAANRLVGEKNNNVLEYGAFGIGVSPITDKVPSKWGFNSGGGSDFVAPEGMAADNALLYGTMLTGTRTSGSQIITLAFGLGVISLTETNASGALVRYTQVYTTKNTTKDANGFIKAASPIVKVFADKVELNDDAVAQDVTFVKNGVGDYTITTVSGLSTDGWYIELPKDINGNPKVAVTLTETDGIISLKCYKRIFSMETFTFVPDLDEPMDVPDGRWIDLRLNEIVDDEPTEPLE